MKLLLLFAAVLQHSACLVAPTTLGKAVLRDSQVQWVRTAQGTTDRLTPQAPLSFEKDFTFPSTIAVNRSATFQQVLGFGGAFTESTSYIFHSLSPELQARVLDMYFGKDGLQYSMARLPIGSCDFSLATYMYDNTSGDFNLTKFSIQHDEKMIIPFIKSALNVRSTWTKDPLHIVASPWSAPGWMKENGHELCYPSGCLTCLLKDTEQYKSSWALYFSKFISAYNKAGISIWGVTVQNEPEYCPQDYEGMHFTPETERDFIKGYLGPLLEKNHPEVNIVIYDHNKDHVVEWAKTIFSDPDAAKYVWGTGVHWYTGDQFDNLNITHHLFPDKPILATEATEVREKDPQNPVWEKGEHYAHDIMGDMNNWAVGFIDWNLLLDMLGGPNHKGPDECEGADLCGSDAMILADTKNQAIYPQVFYWYVGHISKFVPRGSVRIGMCITNSTLEAAAFVTPTGQVVLVVMNTGSADQTVKLADVSPGGGARALKFVALAHSIQTFTFN